MRKGLLSVPMVHNGASLRIGRDGDSRCAILGRKPLTEGKPSDHVRRIQVEDKSATDALPTCCKVGCMVVVINISAMIVGAIGGRSSASDNSPIDVHACLEHPDIRD